MSDERPPRVFISYSWTTPEYAARVEGLASDLVRDGVHIVLDQWDLTEGQDKHAFMEQCVGDVNIDRVLILIDPRYVERADKREGGVGTETLVISSEVYARANQTKFIPVVMQRGDGGQVLLPVYLSGRIYIDLSDAERRQDQYERLVRNLHGKPERTRPTLGRIPGYLQPGAIELRTGQALPLFRQALLQERASQGGYLEEYLERLAGVYEEEELETSATIDALEEQVSANIDRFLPYRDEFIEALESLGRYGTRVDLYDRLHSFFERLISLRFIHTAKRWPPELETEHLSFLSWELFLYSIGALLRSNRFEGVERLLRPYLIRSRTSSDGALRSFSVVGTGFRLLQERRQRRLNTTWRSASAQLLRERAHKSFPFDVLVEADSLLWARSMLSSDETGGWWPHTVVYRENHGVVSLPVWSRLRGDETYFECLAPILGISNRLDAKARIDRLGEQPYFQLGFVSLGRRTLAEMLGI